MQDPWENNFLNMIASQLCALIFYQKERKRSCVYMPSLVQWKKRANKREMIYLALLGLAQLSCDRNLKQWQVKTHIHEGFSMVRSRCVDAKDSDSISIRHYTSYALRCPAGAWMNDPLVHCSDKLFSDTISFFDINLELILDKTIIYDTIAVFT